MVSLFVSCYVSVAICCITRCIGILTCSNLVCPPGSYKCTLHQTNSHSQRTIETDVKCLDAKGAVLDSSYSNAPNDSDEVVDNYAEQTLGNEKTLKSSVVCNNCRDTMSSEEERQLQWEMEREIQESNDEMEIEMGFLQNELDDMFDY